MFKRAKFIKATLDPKEFPPENLPEIALVGRSNVGKSSLINHFLSQKNIARTSSTPGKTQTINFFTVDDILSLVDLPGYGYAKVSKVLRAQWYGIVELYLKNRASLRTILFLLDLRRTPNEEDRAFVDWAKFHHKHLLLLFTKADLIKHGERQHKMNLARSILGNDLPYLPYSIKDNQGRSALFHQLRGIWD